MIFRKAGIILFNKIDRNQVIAGIFALMIFISGVLMIRIAYNQSIVESYESATKVLPEKTKIGMMDRFWQEYTGGTRQSVSQSEASAAKSAVDSSYGFMFGVDVVLAIAAAILLIQPFIVKRFGDKKPKREKNTLGTEKNNFVTEKNILGTGKNPQ
jgi:hypothetical protein